MSYVSNSSCEWLIEVLLTFVKTVCQGFLGRVCVPHAAHFGGHAGHEPRQSRGLDDISHVAIAVGSEEQDAVAHVLILCDTLEQQRTRVIMMSREIGRNVRLDDPRAAK